MRVPTRKPGQYSHFKPDPNLTEEKYKELKNKLERLIKISRPQAAKEMQLHAQDGDFSENAPYQSAKSRLRGINSRILEIEDHLKNAVIIRSSRGGNVRLGSRVTVDFERKQKTFLILGSSETDPSAGVISHNSPIGSALIGKKTGDSVIVQLANKKVLFRIIQIE
jgi:transcription elongation factor GreA